MDKQKKNKICHLTSVHADGDVRIFHKECVSAAKAGYETYLILPNTTPRTEKGVNIISFKTTYTSRLKRMTKTVKKVLEEALKIDADIYHFHDPELLQLVKPLKKRGKIVVYDVHEDLPRQIIAKPWIPKPIRKFIAVIVERYENKKAKKCDAIITATPFIRDRFLKVNDTTIDVNNFPILEELVLQTNYKDKKGQCACYVGGISKTRGALELIEALQYADYSLLLAGNFLEQGLYEKAMQSEGWKKVEALGFLDRAGVKEVYQRAKVGLVTLHPIPNYLDALPVKMFEYMAAGLPIVASDFPFWRSIVTENKCGLLADPLQPKEIAAAVTKILADPAKAEEMGQNGQKAVLEKYNWSIEEKKLLKLYNQLTKN